MKLRLPVVPQRDGGARDRARRPAAQNRGTESGLNTPEANAHRRNPLLKARDKLGLAECEHDGLHLEQAGVLIADVVIPAARRGPSDPLPASR